MARTSVGISFGLVDVSAKSDTTATVTDKQPFVNPQDLSLEGVYAPKAATLETDYWKLDGTFKVFPDNPQDTSWGVWSNMMSEADGTFPMPITLTLNFSSLHESLGLTFEFNPYDNSYCNQLNIKWYQGASLLHDLNFQPAKWQYSCMQKVENYNKIVITFYSMNKPDRYLKVQNIMHGVIKDFGGSELKTATLVEETDLTGLTLSVSTLDFTLHSEDDEFNIFNPSGIYELLQKKQQLITTGEKDGELINLGTFYVDEMESESDKMVSIGAIDAIGIMEGTIFEGGMYNNVLASAVIEEIMNSAGFGYTLDNSLSIKGITGHIPICSHREALQYVVFAIGGFVTTSRSGTVNIKGIPDIGDTPTVTIGRDRKHIGTTVKLREYVTGVDLTEHTYTLDSVSTTISTTEISTGLNYITFSQPAANLSTNRGTITKSGVNYCVVNSSTAGECIITGKAYKDSQKIISVRLPDIEAGEKENIYSVDCPLINPNNSLMLSEHLLAMKQYRIEQSLNFALDGEAVGNLADIETSYGVYRGSIIESLDTNLTGGFVTKAVTVGE